MKLVPLGDRVVLKQLESRGDNQIRNCIAGTDKRKDLSRQKLLR